MVLLVAVKVPPTVNGVLEPVSSKVFAPGVNVVVLTKLSDVALTLEPSCKLVEAVAVTTAPRSFAVALLSVQVCVPPLLNVTVPPLVTVELFPIARLPLMVIPPAGIVDEAVLPVPSVRLLNVVAASIALVPVYCTVDVPAEINPLLEPASVSGVLDEPESVSVVAPNAKVSALVEPLLPTVSNPETVVLPLSVKVTPPARPALTPTLKLL